MLFDEINTIYIKPWPKFTTHCSYFCLLSKNSSKVFLVYITLSSDVFLFPIWTLKRNQKYKVKTKPKKTQYTFGDCDCFQSGDNFFTVITRSFNFLKIKRIGKGLQCRIHNDIYFLCRRYSTIPVKYL